MNRWFSGSDLPRGVHQYTLCSELGVPTIMPDVAEVRSFCVCRQRLGGVCGVRTAGLREGFLRTLAFMRWHEVLRAASPGPPRPGWREAAWLRIRFLPSYEALAQVALPSVAAFSAAVVKEAHHWL
ncbi:MAG TPA: hypothetical protein VD866_25660 [Urbifossiella sp.]|nr:hypothetical protein [Urbifossiella sp.]